MNRVTRLQQRIKEAQKRWEVLSERIQAMTLDLSLAQDGDSQVVLQERLATLKKEREDVEAELDRLEQRQISLGIENASKLDISPNDETKDDSPHITIVITNREDKTLFCRAPCHAIYDLSGKNIKRDISDYANHFSWSGGSDGGTKEIPSTLDGTINLVRVNKHGHGIAFLFDENPHSYWTTEGVYRVELTVTGTAKEDPARVEFIRKRIAIEFEYIKNETRDSIGGVVNNSQLKLLNWVVCK